MLDLYSSIVSCLQVVHLFGSDKVYIHYGTFQFLSNAFITKPCVYDMKKVIRPPNKYIRDACRMLFFFKRRLIQKWAFLYNTYLLD
jgi:hypothetical protein